MPALAVSRLCYESVLVSAIMARLQPEQGHEIH